MSARSPQQLTVVAVNGLMLIALLVALVFNLGRLPLFNHGTTYRAEFSDASGLVQGEDVRIAGIKVGTVKGIKLGSGRVVVSFTVAGVPLGRSTTAGIALQTLLGQHYLSVTPAGSGQLGRDAVIPLGRTSTPVNIVPAFEQVTSEVGHLDTAQMAHAFDVLASTLKGVAPQVGPTLKGLARLSQTVDTRDDAIRELFQRASEVSGTVASRDRQIAQLISDTDSVLQVLDQRRAVITQIIDDTASLGRQLSGLVRDNGASIKIALDKLDEVLKVLRADRAQIDQTITYAGVYANEFTAVGGSGRWFDTAVKFPRSLSLCTTNDAPNPLGALLNPLLSSLNSSVNGSSQPCLPLGPATGATK